MTTRPIEVTGASGNIGGAVVSGLLDDVMKLTGRSPTPFCDVVERASDSPTSS